MKRGRKKGSLKGTPKGKGRVSLTLSFYPHNKTLLNIWKDQTGMGYSELVRRTLEEVSNQRWVNHPIFGWILKRLIDIKMEEHHG